MYYYPSFQHRDIDKLKTYGFAIHGCIDGLGKSAYYCVLSLVTFVHLYRPYLICRKFTLRTDHGSLTWLRNFKEPESQLARWLEQLQELNFEIVHRRGRSHQNADALSRLPCRQCGSIEHEPSPAAEIAVTTLQLPATNTSHTLRQTQLDDLTLGPVLRGKESDKKPERKNFQPLTKAALRLLHIWDQLTVKVYVDITSLREEPLGHSKRSSPRF